MKRHRSLATVIAAIVLAVACTSDDAGDDDATPTAVEPTTLSVWVSGDPEETQAFVDVADAFEASAGRDRRRRGA